MVVPGYDSRLVAPAGCRGSLDVSEGVNVVVDRHSPVGACAGRLARRFPPIRQGRSGSRTRQARPADRHAAARPCGRRAPAPSCGSGRRDGDREQRSPDGDGRPHRPQWRPWAGHYPIDAGRGRHGGSPDVHRHLAWWRPQRGLHGDSRAASGRRARGAHRRGRRRRRSGSAVVTVAVRRPRTRRRRPRGSRAGVPSASNCTATT
jgi:hypothetical protein